MKTLEEVKAVEFSTAITYPSVLLRKSGYSFFEFDKEWWKEFVKEYEQRVITIASGLDEPNKLDQFIAYILEDCY